MNLENLSPEFRALTDGYREALAWSTSGDFQGRELESLEGFAFSEGASLQIALDCLAFVEANRAALEQAATVPGYSWAHAGHDFWLTRAGHGAGFWDGDLPDDIGDTLTEASKAAGEVWPYIGDDSLIYLS